MATPIPKNRAELGAREAAAATGGELVRDAGKVARGIVSDTRAISGGEAFVALRGEHHDGHAFLAEATRRGASLLVVDRADALPEGPSVVRAKDTLAAWGDLAKAHLDAWRSDDARVIAITGSAGKTTTKQLCAALLEGVAKAWASPGNLNNLVGVPAVVFALERSHRFAVIECGMSVRGEIARLAEIVRPDVAVITNVSVAHAEGVGGTRADVAREKGAIYGTARDACVFDADDAMCAGLAEKSSAPRKLGFGRSERAHYRLLDRVSRGASGSRVTIERPCADCASPNAREIVEVELPFVGEAAAIDLCAALAAAEAAAGALGQDVLDAAMARVTNVAGRAGIVELGEVLVIDDTYNANPASMRAALAILVDLSGTRRRVAVLGEMKELGETSRAEHLALGEALKTADVALAIGCGGLATDTMTRAAELGVEAIACVDVGEAAELATARVKPGDVVLVKGSRSVGAERVVTALRASRGAT